MTSQKNVVVVGGGPGGYVCAIRLAQLGASVIVIERERMGGTCLNWGCIPTKVLVHTAELYHEAVNAADLGLHFEGVSINWKELMTRKEQVVEQLVGGVEGLMAANNISVITGEASFLSSNTLQVNDTVISFDTAIIATGSETVIPPIPGIDIPGVITSREALDLDRIPHSLTVIGGGVVGMEFASIYSILGTKVTVIEMLDSVLSSMDGDITSVVKGRLEGAGVRFHTSSQVTGFTMDGNIVATSVKTPTGPMVVHSEKTLLSVGRRPATNSLLLENAGIRHDRGRILVDEAMSTSTPNIYAIGDCCSSIQLAHVASAQGEVAAENVMGHRRFMEYKTVPSCVYTLPEVASVGLSESEAIRKGYEVQVGRFPLSANGKSLIMKGYDGLVKFVVDRRYDEILGVHMVGPRVTDLIVEGALALRLEATVEEIVTTIHAHPTIGEALGEAAMAVHHRAVHMPPTALPIT
ncbi:MAG: dihydrolipoyl dehydrogenase [Dethiosulfovibrio peptidovorans]|nr:MAG: dihydrolipoyl dehydrogenase [Dethiosulfovibrio peptidovorans]